MSKDQMTYKFNGQQLTEQSGPPTQKPNCAVNTLRYNEVAQGLFLTVDEQIHNISSSSGVSYSSPKTEENTKDAMLTAKIFAPSAPETNSTKKREPEAPSNRVHDMLMILG